MNLVGRKVKVFEFAVESIKDTPDSAYTREVYVKKFRENGVFLGFGLDCDGEEASYTVAIVEFEDRHVEFVSIELIKFID